MQEKQAMALVRKKLLEEFDFYSEHALRIRTKKGTVVPFKLNAAQEKLLSIVKHQMETTGKVRIIILKARQLGLSTAVGGWLYWYVSQHTAQKALVVTHHSDSTRALFDMTRRYHENVPTILKPSTKYSSRQELSFNELDSSYMVATAGGSGVARGETITQAHLSELAFWAPGSAKENLNGILQAIPNEKNTAIFIESTANGVTGPFFEMWNGAVNGENGYYPLFLPWTEDDEYREEVSEHFERTPEEDELVEKYGLDDEQLMFRRRKVAQNGREMFMQEYPIVPEEAFISTGRPVFDSEWCMDKLQSAPDLKERLALEGTKWVPHRRGELVTYRSHDPGDTYYIGADVAMGIRNGDYSVAQVLDSKKRQVAVWRGHVHPDYFADVLYALGEYYNFGKIAVESNNHGLLTVNRLYKDLQYPDVYSQEIEDDEQEKDTTKLGFRTTVKSKPLIIDNLRGSMREGEIEIYDKITLKEMMTYVVTESGKLQAEEGNHDDCVISLAIANHIHEGVWNPITNQDSWYSHAI